MALHPAAIDPARPNTALILTATFTGLRFGELLALRREDIDLLRRTVNVDQQLYELSDGSTTPRSPEDDGWASLVALPPPLIPELEHHLETWTAPEPRSPRVHIARRWADTPWQLPLTCLAPAVRRAGLERLRFHDLRHTGNTLGRSDRCEHP